MASLLYGCFCHSLKPSVALLWEHINQAQIASFTKFYLLKQESMIIGQHLDLGKASFEFSFDTLLHSMCDSKLVLSVTSSVGRQ